MAASNDFQKILSALSIAGDLTYRESKESAVTTYWGVEWDADMVARDLMQNFVDANRGDFEGILIRRSKSLVAVTAPTEFNLQRLYYLGSEKEADDIGQFGEGFKAAAVCILRDPKSSIFCISGGQGVRISLASEGVASSDMRPLAYDFFELSQHHAATTLIVGGTSRELAAAIEKSKEHFEWNGHPQFGAPIWSGGSIAAYHSNGDDGWIFYRGLRRGELKHFPIILTLSDKTPKVERIVATDRDRKAFGPEVIEAFVSDFFGKSIYPGELPAQLYVALLEAGKAHWRTGHPIFRVLSEKRQLTPPARAEVKPVFGEGYFAKDRQNYSNWEDRAAASEIARKWESAGRIKLPNYFTAFGLDSPSDTLRTQKQKLLAELKQSQSRTPTDAESCALQTLDGVLAAFAPQINTLFEALKRQFRVVESDAILGELRAGRSYNEKIVLLSANVFVGDFAAAVAIHLHEHAHILGYDGSRQFTDALTMLIETILRRRTEFAPFEADWSAARAKVEDERALLSKNGNGSLPIADMNEVQLRSVLARIPPHVLNQFLH